MLFRARLLFRKEYKANCVCPAEPKMLELPDGFAGHNELLSHYLGFAELYGGLLSGAKVRSWMDVEEHTAHGFLSHLKGLGVEDDKIKEVAGLLFELHSALFAAGAILWKPQPDEWQESLQTLLSDIAEEVSVVVEAWDLDDAWECAAEAGKAMEFTYENPYGDEVSIKFERVIEVSEIVT